MSNLRGGGAQQLVRRCQDWPVRTPQCVGSTRSAAGVQDVVGDLPPFKDMGNTLLSVYGSRLQWHGVRSLESWSRYGKRWFSAQAPTPYHGPPTDPAKPGWVSNVTIIKVDVVVLNQRAPL